MRLCRPPDGLILGAMDRHVRQVFAELEMVGWGTTASWDSSGGGEGSSERIYPPGDSNPPYLFWRAEYLAARTDLDRRRVVVDARADLERLRGHGIDRSHVVGESRESEEQRLLVEGEGFTADEVARLFKCTPSRVRRVRRLGQRSVELGKPLPLVVSVGTDQRRVKAREYHGQGMTLTQIGRLLGCDKATVSRDLRAA